MGGGDGGKFLWSLESNKSVTAGDSPCSNLTYHFKIIGGSPIEIVEHWHIYIPKFGAYILTLAFFPDTNLLTAEGELG